MRRSLTLALLVALVAICAAPAAAPGTDRAARGDGGVHPPNIKWDPIPYKHDRKHQMANYSKRHYGKREWRLRHVRALVLHYTASGSYSSVHSTFASNAPSLGERPGVCAQFVVDKDGTVYQLVRRSVRCRHTIGLNQLSLGVEMVQEQLGSSHASDRAILERDKQARAAVRLVAWLKQKYGVRMRNVIGHSMANDSPLFKDKQGWRNDHTDWLKRDVRTFRKRVNRLLRKSRDRGRPVRIERTSSRFPHKRTVFGHSVRGHRLVAERIGNPEARRRVLVVGEIHGNEEAGRKIVDQLRHRHDSTRSAEIWTVRTINPDGHAADSRTNAHGVDLNRNFSVGWRSSSAGAGDYGGPEPFSEPETRAARRLIDRVRPDLTIWYHQPWNAVLAPCHGKARAEKRYAKLSGMRVDRCRGEGLPGTATRWEERRRTTAFVVELPSGGITKARARRQAGAAASLAARR